MLDWDQVDWGPAEDDVRRLRQRIFTASMAGDPKRVRNLQKLMIRARANALLSVRRVTEINAGRKTAGVDGKTALMASQKAELADWVQQQRTSSWTSVRGQLHREAPQLLRQDRFPQDRFDQLRHARGLPQSVSAHRVEAILPCHGKRSPHPDFPGRRS